MATRRIWLDATGVRPGSEAAIFAEHLIAGFGRLSVDAVLCRRDPGLGLYRWPALVLCDRLPEASAPSASRLRRVWDALPERTRAAIRQFVRLQRAALAGREGGRVTRDAVTPAAVMADTARPGSGDVVLMMGASGDASRFAADGVRLALLLVDATPFLRRDWLTPRERIEADLWFRATQPHVGVVISATGAPAGWDTEVTGIAGASVAGSPSPAAPMPHRRFVLAAGPIGAAGQTRHLLLAWRRLMETVSGLPDLVIAGAAGALADDVLAQIRNSDGLGGKIVLVQSPSPAFEAALLRDCVFCIAMAAPGGWGRIALNAAVAGKACLSATPHPENAARLAADIAAYLASPPPPAVPVMRDWDDVARDVLRAISA